MGFARAIWDNRRLFAFRIRTHSSVLPARDIRHATLCSGALAGMCEKRRLLPVTMQFSTPIQRKALAARFRGGMGVVLFLAGVVFAPLCSAITLCTMPCCDHAAPSTPSVATELPCQTNCAVTRSDVVKEADATQVPTSPESALLAAPAIVDTVTSPPQATTGSVAYAVPPPDRALHLVNSVFLI